MTLTNEGKVPSLHWVEINYRTYTQLSPDLRYFHAQYRQGTPPAEGPYLILDARGDGHLIGCVLSIKNNDGGWWGEGDEIVWIDGKQTIQGTGSEDYFCESYGLRTGCFPYFGVTLLEEPYITAYRWHVPDPVPFRRSIRFLIEHGNGNPPFRSGNFYYSVAYWYQTEPHAPFPAAHPRSKNTLGSCVNPESQCKVKSADQRRWCRTIWSEASPRRAMVPQPWSPRSATCSPLCKARYGISFISRRRIPPGGRPG